MRNKGLPFILGSTESDGREDVAKGFRASLIAEVHKGNYNGIMAAGLVTTTYEGSGEYTSNFKGACVSGIGNLIDGHVKGACAGGVGNIILGDMDGVSLAGAFNFSEGLSGLSVGAINDTHENSGSLVQIGLSNKVGDWYRKRGFVVQIGIYNRAEEQTIPLINIRGFKELYLSLKEFLMPADAEGGEKK